MKRKSPPTKTNPTTRNAIVDSLSDGLCDKYKVLNLFLLQFLDRFMMSSFEEQNSLLAMCSGTSDIVLLSQKRKFFLFMSQSSLSGWVNMLMFLYRLCQNSRVTPRPICKLSTAQHLKEGKLSPEIMALLPSEQTRHWHSCYAPGPAISSVASTGILAAFHCMLWTCPKELFGFVGKILTPRVIFQGSRVSVWFHCHVANFFPLETSLFKL